MIDRRIDTVSVAMATYNGEKYIKEQIDSILDNLTEKDELIISDDSSDDRTKAIIQQYINRDNRIKFYVNPEQGVKSNFQNAINHCNNKYIFLADQDDVWCSDKVKIVLETIKKTGCKIVLHDAVIMIDNKIDRKNTVYSYRNSKRGFTKNIVKNSYMGCCMAFSREIVNYILPIPPSVHMHDQWIGLLGDLNGWVCVIPNQLIIYRRHGSNVTELNRHSNLIKMIQNRMVYIIQSLKRYLENKEYVFSVK